MEQDLTLENVHAGKVLTKEINDAEKRLKAYKNRKFQRDLYIEDINEKLKYIDHIKPLVEEQSYKNRKTLIHLMSEINTLIPD